MTQGAYPTFVANTKDYEKKLSILEFIRDERGIRVVDAVQNLFKNQFIKAIDKDFILELKQGIQEWNDYTLSDLLTHACTKYAAMDNLVYKTITRRLADPPNMDLSIDKYFTKQEECQLLASVSDNPNTNVAMVLQMTTHLGVTRIINRSVTKFKRQEKANKTWKGGKIWFNRDLKASSDKAKAAGIKPGYQANMRVKIPLPRDKAQEELAEGMRE